MRFDVIALFPEIVDYPLSFSIIGRVRKKGIIEIGFVNPRDFTKDKHHTVDDKPYGGGSGMLIMCQPLYDAIKSVRKKNSYVVLLTPRGRLFNQEIAKSYSKKKHIILICGHYEGVDERITRYVDDELSVGDYVLSCGEIAAVCVIDAVSRLLPGSLSDGSLDYESFSNGLLEYPQYTKPQVWHGMRVPDVLLSGNHKNILEWRLKKSIEITKQRRPELYDKYIKGGVNEQSKRNNERI